ncbi:MAG: DNA translocase FtsK [Campylobacter sp.]|nr:DNA translocase FtsK [Campylobacter sp.]
MVGSVGKLIGGINLSLFGYIAYIYPFLGLFLLYLSYKNFAKFNIRVAEILLGGILTFFAILIIQAFIFGVNGGYIGTYIILGLKDFIGNAGILVFVCVLFSLAFVLLFENKFALFVSKLNFLNKKDDQTIESEFEDIKQNLGENPQNLDEIQTLNLQNDKNSQNLDEEKLDEPAKIITTKPAKLAKIITDSSLDDNLEFNEQDDIKNEIKDEIKNDDIVKPDELNRVEHLKEVAENKKLLEALDKGEVPKVKDFILPPLKFLADPPKQKKSVDEGEIDKKIYDLLEKLRMFKINGDVVRTYSGPVVTTFEFRPAADVKVSKILNLQDDLAMALRAKTIRIQAPIPGKDVVGIEIPNQNIETIYLKEILDSEIYKNASSPLTLALGKDIVGQPFVTDLKKLPHLLIAGTTGSGKSVGINAMLLSLLYRNSPKTLRLIMIDPKMLEFSIYNDIPHLLTPVITEPKQAVTALSNLVAEMVKRYKMMSEIQTKNIENYNEKIVKEGGEEFPYIVVIIDELADLMMTSGKDVEFYINRLAQMSRASGIHLIIATQRPSVDVVTGLIKSNLPSRISFRVGQKIDSKVILDQMGADALLGRGDMLFTPPGSSGLIRLHAPFMTESEIIKVVDHLKAQQTVEYDPSFLREEGDSSEMNNTTITPDGIELDELYEEAKEIVLSEEKTSISYIQRRLKIGYNRAASIMEQLEQMGVLSPINAKGQREIL